MGGKSVAEALMRGMAIHGAIARKRSDPEPVYVIIDEMSDMPEELRGLGRVDAVDSRGEVIFDVKAADMAAFERMIEAIEIRAKPHIDEPRCVSAEYVGRRNKSDRKRNKRDRWR
jgi:hypothetical protein